MKRRILLVEDNAATVKAMREELELLGYEVAIAKDGLEALEKSRSELPDLIVMDIRMPKMDGLQAASRIREDPKTRAIPILAATAKALPGDKEDCLANGCSDYLAKPFSCKQLDAAIKRLMGQESDEQRADPKRG